MALRNKIQEKKGLLIKAAILLPVLLFVIAAFYARTPSHDFLSVAGLQDKAKIRVSVEQGGKQIALTAHDDHSFAAPEILNDNYKISATLQSDSKYQDLQIIVGPSTVKIITTGLNPSNTIQLQSNGITIQSGLHPDWSGKIELSQDLTPKNNSVLCLIAENDFTLCHALRKGGRA